MSEEVNSNIIFEILQGVPEAMEALASILTSSGFKHIETIKNYELFGLRLYELWNGCCNRNDYKTKQVLELLKNKKISKQILDEHLSKHPGIGFDEIINQEIYACLINKKNRVEEILLESIHTYSLVDIFGRPTRVEVEAYKHFIELTSYLLNDKSLLIGIESAFRSFDDQQAVYNELLSQYGSEYAREYVAPVGHSEHHTGQAIDVNVYVNYRWCKTNEELFACEDEFRIMHSHLHKFVFILRYPRDKNTGYPYEPWHIRYVGKNLAKYLYENNLSLDEYHANKKDRKGDCTE
ncbi:M15 family metallopeptidase [Breznakia pachnodae]|uniref:D-alanyl-D-alanine carboxypeptidase-like core domain-containing protein n=1 Tax=Breznakia pachnodae TaxID=265178 RepID=A0ABU0E3Z5_9FIRM|nr:M15 family metallopeptidase [Breznakia pachnodae]MDQ0361614.1 hypothetical protein [Breznakia pachnodae]